MFVTPFVTETVIDSNCSGFSDFVPCPLRPYYLPIVCLGVIQTANIIHLS